MKTLESVVNSVVGLEYKGTTYLVDYFNYPNETDKNEIEFICIDHENYYLTDKTFEPISITESMLLEDKDSKLFCFNRVL